MDSLRLFVCMISLCICAYAGDKRNANVLEDNIVDSVIRTSRTPIAVSEDRAVTKGARRATEGILLIIGSVCSMFYFRYIMCYLFAMI